jgi:hypothetical protein
MGTDSMEYTYKMKDGAHLIRVEGDDHHGGKCEREVLIYVGVEP